MLMYLWKMHNSLSLSLSHTHTHTHTNINKALAKRNLLITWVWWWDVSLATDHKHTYKLYDLRFSRRWQWSVCHLGCSAVYTGMSLPAFQRSVLPPSVYSALQPKRHPSTYKSYAKKCLRACSVKHRKGLFFSMPPRQNRLAYLRSLMSIHKYNLHISLPRTRSSHCRFQTCPVMLQSTVAEQCVPVSGGGECGVHPPCTDM
jgi:hypothetical protein